MFTVNEVPPPEKTEKCINCWKEIANLISLGFSHLLWIKDKLMKFSLHITQLFLWNMAKYFFAFVHSFKCSFGASYHLPIMFWEKSNLLTITNFKSHVCFKNLTLTMSKYFHYFRWKIPPIIILPHYGTNVISCLPCREIEHLQCNSKILFRIFYMENVLNCTSGKKQFGTFLSWTSELTRGVHPASGYRLQIWQMTT